jgi:anionic cell wall polymer biosynthesis LytR-Cps2A-Psr (LCP) family protein
MEPIPEVVDYIGGVEIDVDVDMKDHGANLSKGLQLLNGSKAFDYIHWRYSGSGDIDRIKRQQKFASAMLKKIKAEEKLTDTIHLILSYKNDVKTNLTLKQLIGMGKLATEIPQGTVQYSIIPGTDSIISNIWYYIPDEAATDQLLKSFFCE